MNNNTEVEFNTLLQKNILRQLTHMIMEIEACDYWLEREKDVNYWRGNKNHYIEQYARKLSELAKGVFRDPLTENMGTVMLGDIRK